MNKLLVSIFCFSTAVSLVACGSGNSVLDLSLSPDSCSLSQSQEVQFDFSGLTVGESVDFRFTAPNGTVYYYANECIVGQESCPFYGDKGTLYWSCGNIAGNASNATGKYIFTLRQVSGSASATLRINP